MIDLLHQSAPVLNWLISSGVAIGATRALILAIKRLRRGVSPRDGKRRLDLVARLAAALAYAHRLRELLIEHDVPTTAIPRWPEILRDQEQA